MTPFYKALVRGFYVFLLLALWSLPVIITGCKEQPPNAISNVELNEITEHEKVVEAFGTADVTGIPTDSHEWIVRDTNGVIWYVSTRRGTSGRTRLFGWHPEFPEPVPGPVAWATNWITNTVTVTITNHIVEDPTK